MSHDQIDPHWRLVRPTNTTLEKLAREPMRIARYAPIQFHQMISSVALAATA